MNNNNNNINKYRDDYYHISENYKRDLTNNDPKIWGGLGNKNFKECFDPMTIILADQSTADRE